jgi:hypothetical protein
LGEAWEELAVFLRKIHILKISFKAKTSLQAEKWPQTALSLSRSDLLTFTSTSGGGRRGTEDISFDDDTMIQFATRSLFSFWPGACKAWDRTDTTSLWIAIGFSWSTCLAIATTCLWEEWLHAWLRFLLCFVLVAFACASGARVILFGEVIPEDTKPARDERFRKAQESYLQGSYFEAEQQLLKNLAINESDIESALLLASVYRRSGKFRESLETLSQLQLKERSARWTTEILVEKDKVLRSKRHSNSGPPPKG